MRIVALDSGACNSNVSRSLLLIRSQIKRVCREMDMGRGSFPADYNITNFNLPSQCGPTSLMICTAYLNDRIIAQICTGLMN